MEIKPVLAVGIYKNTEEYIRQVNNREVLKCVWNLSQDGVRVWNKWGKAMHCCIYCMQVLYKTLMEHRTMTPAFNKD